MLTSKILSYVTKGWDSSKRKSCIRASERNIHWSRIKEQAVPDEHHRAWGERPQAHSTCECYKKGLENILLGKIQAEVITLDVPQGGFIKNRSTYDQILILDTVVRARYRKKRPVWQAFLDIKSAYDTVDRHILWDKCVNMSLEDNTITLLKGLFDTV